MEEVDFLNMIDAYLAENPTLSAKTKTNYRVVRNKLEAYVKESGLSTNLFDYDILAVQQHERRERILLFKEFWNGFIDFNRRLGVSVTTRKSYRQIFSAVIHYAEKQYGVVIQMPKGESTIKWGDRKKELPMNVVEHIFSLSPTHHWAVNVAKLALYSCWRVSDLIDLTADDLIEGEFMGQPCVYLCRMTQKTKKPMRTPVPKALIRDMMRRNNVGPGEPLIKFPGLTRLGTFKKLIEKDISDQMRSLLNSNQFLRDTKITAVNVEGDFVTKPLYMIDRPMHMLRSAGISYLIENGMTPQAVAKWFSGHESLKILEDHYVTTSDFSGAKQLFKDRFISTNLKSGEALQKFFDEENDPQL